MTSGRGKWCPRFGPAGRLKEIAYAVV